MEHAMIRTRLLLAAALFAAFAQPAHAQPDGPPPGPGFGRHGRPGPPPIDRVLERHAAELGLSDEVRAQVREIAQRSEGRVEPLAQALDEARDAMHALLSQDVPDADAVMRQADTVGAAETALHKERLRTLLEVRALLTPAQRAGLVKIFEARRRHRPPGMDGPPPDAP
jgi:Spy/CpxP family protein refolding chaperone